MLVNGGTASFVLYECWMVIIFAFISRLVRRYNTPREFQKGFNSISFFMASSIFETRIKWNGRNEAEPIFFARDTIGARGYTKQKARIKRHPLFLFNPRQGVDTLETEQNTNGNKKMFILNFGQKLQPSTYVHT